MSVRLNKPFIFSSLGVLAVAAGLIAMIVVPSLRGGDAENDADSDTSTAQQTQVASRSSGCVSLAAPTLGSQGLEEMRFRARGFAGRQMHEDALAEFTRIAAVDPGFPGLNLDRSMSLLQLKRSEEASAAIDAQIGISECLAKMPLDQFAAYCRAEVFHGDMDSCRQQMQEILRSAHMQAALIHMELGHDPAARNQTRTAAADFDSHIPPPAAPPATHLRASLDAPVPSPRIRQRAQTDPDALAVRAATPAPRPADHALAKGAGTDADLGAYSK